MSRHKIARTQLLIEHYYERARKARSNIFRSHFLAMAQQLEEELMLSRG